MPALLTSTKSWAAVDFIEEPQSLFVHKLSANHTSRSFFVLWSIRWRERSFMRFISQSKNWMAKLTMSWLLLRGAQRCHPSRGHEGEFVAMLQLHDPTIFPPEPRKGV
eukprot:1888598-Amphidinium_carterae.1